MELEVQPQQQLTGNKQQSQTVEQGDVDPKQETLCQAPGPCVIHQTHLVLEMLCRDEGK